MKLTFHWPALYPAWDSASFSPFRAGPVWALTAPLSGRSEYTSIVLAPELPPELPELPLEPLLALLLLPLEPQAAMTSAVAATAPTDIALRSLMSPPLLTP